MKWRILIHKEKLSPAVNMAIDESILLGNIDGTSLATIRFYDWLPATASIGYNQKAEREVDFDLLKKFGYGFVRRPTGGRLVLHKDEITYAVISQTIERLSGNIINSYSEISKALAEGLLLMGVDASFEKGTLGSSHQREANNPCFTSASKYELKVNKKKIVGSAQVRKENCLLQHGSILLDNGQDIVADILPNLDDDKRKKLKKFLAKKTTCINEELSEVVSFDEGVLKLVEGFRRSWAEDDFIIHANLTKKEKEKVDELVSKKYNSQDWNYRK